MCLKAAAFYPSNMGDHAIDFFFTQKVGELFGLKQSARLCGGKTA
jgi:hypothetical protein